MSYSDADWAGNASDSGSTSRYYIFICGNLVTLRSKKQNVVARSSSEAEYHAIAKTVCELFWIRNLLQELRFSPNKPIVMYCDNQAAIYIASNHVFHERIKHIEIDCRVIKDATISGALCTPYVRYQDQVGDIFTKVLRKSLFSNFCSMLMLFNLYTPA